MNLYTHIETLNQQDQRKVSAKWLLEVCRCVCGTQLSDRTYRRWKGIIDVVEFRRELRWGEALGLVALAYLKRGNPFRPVQADQILKVLLSPAHAQVLGEFLDGTIQVGIPGKEIAAILYKQTGRLWSRATLYRKLPGFSETAVYYAADIDRFKKILGHRETETAA